LSKNIYAQESFYICLDFRVKNFSFGYEKRDWRWTLS